MTGGILKKRLSEKCFPALLEVLIEYPIGETVEANKVLKKLSRLGLSRVEIEILFDSFQRLGYGVVFNQQPMKDDGTVSAGRPKRVIHILPGFEAKRNEFIKTPRPRIEFHSAASKAAVRAIRQAHA